MSDEQIQAGAMNPKPGAITAQKFREREEIAPIQAPNIRTPEASAMEVFFAWEKLRLAYNAVLFVVVCICAAVPRPQQLNPLLFCIDAIMGVLIANLGFCAGPVAEGYLVWVGVPRLASRIIVFCLGTLGAILETVSAVERMIGNHKAW